MDLILLNPPFSYKSSTGIAFNNRQGYSTKCSPAMSFILNAIDFLSINGQVVGIFPDSVLWSERDRSAREHILHLGYEFTTHRHLPSNTFPGYTVSTSIISLKRSESTHSNHNTDDYSENIVVDRGKLQVHKSLGITSKSSKSPLFIHTTHLKSNQISHAGAYRVSSNKIIGPPYVLLPRVGNPNKEKITIVRRGKYVLSDCLIYVKTNDFELEDIQSTLMQKIDLIYGGSCAKYTTIARVRKILRINLGNDQRGNAP
ncbi:N-6 DNA methylase [Deinococcus aquaticus]|uniref:N-6 DNA methylase n=1 Tax=Deinococcus aquaticus TaxID=328692 RepID=UPI00361FB039